MRKKSVDSTLAPELIEALVRGEHRDAFASLGQHVVPREPDAGLAIRAFLRGARDPEDFLVFICNFTPVVQHRYRIGVPHGGFYRELLNTDSATYGGSNVSNAGGVSATAVPHHGRPYALELTLPPLAALVFQPEGRP